MNNPVMLLAFTAASIGFLHTLIGPDHYLPVIAMGKARNWSMPRSMMSVVLISSWGLNFVRVRPLERYSHALAGASICASGLAIQFLGL